MAQKFVTIGSLVNVHVYEDGTHSYGFETDGVAYVGTAPTNPNEVLRLTDVPTPGTIVTAGAAITDHTIVRGDGGARGIQDSGILIDDSDNLTLPDGAVFAAHNSDHSHLFSRAVIGYIGSGNEAGLQHRALALDGTNYAIQQLNLGTTYVNCVTGKEINFCRNDVTLVTLTQLTSLVNDSMVDALHRHSELSASDGTPDQAVFVNATGQVGIGTTSPSSALHIKAGVSGLFGQIVIQNPANDVTSNVAITAYESDGSGNPDQQLWYLGSSAGANENITFLNRRNAILVLGTNNTTRMTILGSGDVGIGTATPDTKLQVVGDFKVGDDDTNYTTVSTTGDLSFVGSATIWNDIYFPMSSGRIGGANQPTWAAFQGNIEEYTFGINDYIHLPSGEILHSYKEGSDLKIHVHIVTNGTEGTDTQVNYEVEYTIGDIDEVISAATVITSGNTTIASGTTDRTHKRIEIGTITGTNLKTMATIKMRFRRIARVGGTADPAVDPFVTMVGIHIEEDTVGSRTEQAK